MSGILFLRHSVYTRLCSKKWNTYTLRKYLLNHSFVCAEVNFSLMTELSVSSRKFARHFSCNPLLSTCKLRTTVSSDANTSVKHLPNSVTEIFNINKTAKCNKYTVSRTLSGFGTYNTSTTTTTHV